MLSSKCVRKLLLKFIRTTDSSLTGQMTKPNPRANHRVIDRKRTHEKIFSKKEDGSLLTSAEEGQRVLFVLRHGEAGARMINTAEDTDRALTTDGRTEIREIGKSLKRSGITASQIVTSPLRRARETAEIVAHTLKIPLLEEWEELKPDGDRESLYRRLARIEKSSTLVVVGHEPYLTSMIGEIIGAPNARLSLKKGGLAKLRITSFVPHISGELRWLLTPKLMAGMS